MPIRVLARMSDAFKIVENNLIRRIVYSILTMISAQEVDNDANGCDWSYTQRVALANFQILFEATEMDDTRFVLDFPLIAYPDLIWENIDGEHAIFHIAVMHCHQMSENVVGQSCGCLLSVYFLGIDILQSGDLHLSTCV